MKVKIISDVHLEHRFFIPNDIFSGSEEADVCILAGDIGYPNSDLYQEFIENVKEKYQKTFMITGNHEYYDNTHLHLTMDNIDYTCEMLEDDNLTFLNRNFELYKGYHFLGCTLWSNLCGDKIDCAASINDFKFINGLSKKEYNLFHIRDREWITKEIQNFPNIPKVVITHHLPSYQLIAQKYKFSPLNHYYASDLEYLMGDDVGYWICGHSHCQTERNINGTTCVINAYGYPEEISTYRTNYLLEI